MPVTINGTTGLVVPTLEATTSITTPNLNGGNIVGQVCFFAMATAPTGFLACNGAAVSRTTYAALFAAIGTLYGSGDGSTTFNLPDLRGEFIRGWDDARGVDSGRAFGSAQSSQNLAHNHTGTADSAGAHTHNVERSTGASSEGSVVRLNAATNSTSGADVAGAAKSAGAHTHTLTINNNGGSEARPRNVALLPCIKF